MSFRPAPISIPATRKSLADPDVVGDKLLFASSISSHENAHAQGERMIVAAAK